MSAFSRSVILLLFSLLLLTVSIAVLTTLVPLWLNDEQVSTAAIGFVGSSYFLGNLIGAIFAGHIISHIGFNRCYYLACVIFIISTLCLAMSILPISWAVWRFFAGIACAGIWVVVESALLRSGTDKTRGVLLAAYMAVYYLGTVLGNLLIHTLPQTSFAAILPWIIIVSIFAIIPLFFAKFNKPDTFNGLTQLKKMFILPSARIGLIGCVISGIIVGLFYSMLSLYLRNQGISDNQIAYLLVILISAGIIAQFPIDHFAEKYGRATLLMLQSVMIILASFLLLLVPSSLYIALILLGCFGFTLYPLSMAWGCAHVTKDELVPMDQALLFSFTTGCLVAPLFTAILMQALGDSWLFLVIAGCAFFFLLTLLYHLYQTKLPT